MTREQIGRALVTESIVLAVGATVVALAPLVLILALVATGQASMGTPVPSWFSPTADWVVVSGLLGLCLSPAVGFAGYKLRKSGERATDLRGAW